MTHLKQEKKHLFCLKSYSVFHLRRINSPAPDVDLHDLAFTCLIPSFSLPAHFFYPSHTDFLILPQGCQEYGQWNPLILLFLLPGTLFSHMPTKTHKSTLLMNVFFPFQQKLSFLMAKSPEYRAALANAGHFKRQETNKQQQQKLKGSRKENPHLLTTDCTADDYTVPEKNALSHLIPKQR